MNYTQLKDLNLSSEMMDASQIESLISHKTENDHTAFEVLPTKTEIKGGTVWKIVGQSYEKMGSNYGGSAYRWDSEKTYEKGNIANFGGYAWVAHERNVNVQPGKLSSVYSDILGDDVHYTISPNRVEQIELDSNLRLSSVDIVIDWGNGDKYVLKDMVGDANVTETFNETEKENAIIVTYTYPESDSDKKWTVRILGKDYFTVRHCKNENNLACRCFDTDLPIASCVRNVSSLFMKSQRITKVVIPSYWGRFCNIINFASLFQESLNLYKAIGFGNKIFGSLPRNIGLMFHYCTSLKKCDFKFPPITQDGSYLGIFLDDYFLSGNIGSFLPDSGFSNRKIKMTQTFNCCKGILSTGIDPDILWGDTSKKWIQTNQQNNESTFGGSGLAVVVPDSWRGL